MIIIYQLNKSRSTKLKSKSKQITDNNSKINESHPVSPNIFLRNNDNTSMEISFNKKEHKTEDLHYPTKMLKSVDRTVSPSNPFQKKKSLTRLEINTLQQSSPLLSIPTKLVHTIDNVGKNNDNHVNHNNHQTRNPNQSNLHQPKFDLAKIQADGITEEPKVITNVYQTKHIIPLNPQPNLVLPLVKKDYKNCVNCIKKKPKPVPCPPPEVKPVPPPKHRRVDVYNPVPIMTHYNMPILHHIPVNQLIRKYVPVYYPVPVEHRINIPVRIPIKVPQRVLIPQAVPYGVKVPVPFPVKVEVPRYKDVEVKKNVYVKVPIYEHIPIYHHFAIQKELEKNKTGGRGGNSSINNHGKGKNKLKKHKNVKNIKEENCDELNKELDSYMKKNLR